MDDLLELGKTILAAQPFSRLLGAELLHFSSGRVELALPLTSQLTQQHGFAHGGVVSYLADNALTFAGGSTLGPAVVTSEYKINYLRPATGSRLVARAQVIHSGSSQAVCRCEIFMIDAEAEQLCAVAQGTIARVGQAPQNSVD